MSTATSVFSYSVGRKLVMSLTGLFLVSFLLVHLSGNLQLFYGDNGVSFNHYTRFMTTNPLIRAMEIFLLLGFGFHIAFAIIVTLQNRKARPRGYVNKKGVSASSTWFSRNMLPTGLLVLAFLIIHLIMFWGNFHYGNGKTVGVDQAYKEGWKIIEAEPVTNSLGELVVAPEGYIETEAQLLRLKQKGVTEVRGVSMYEVVKESFGSDSMRWFIVPFYVICMLLLGFHLNHGFQSGFRTLGLDHKKYTPLISGLGTLISVVFPLLFAAMPLWFFIKGLF